MVAKAAIVGATVVVLAIIGLILGVYIAKRNERIRARDKGQALKGDLNRSQEVVLLNLLADAASIFQGLGQNNSSGLDDIEIIRANTKIDVGRWLVRYNNTKEKVSK